MIGDGSRDYQAEDNTNDNAYDNLHDGTPLSETDNNTQ